MAGHRRKCQPVRAVIPEGETRQGFVSERRPFPDRVCVAEHSAFGAGASLSRLGVAGGCIAEVGAQRALPSRGLRSEPWQAGAAGGAGGEGAGARAGQGRLRRRGCRRPPTLPALARSAGAHTGVGTEGALAVLEEPRPLRSVGDKGDSFPSTSLVLLTQV